MSSQGNWLYCNKCKALFFDASVLLILIVILISGALRVSAAPITVATTPASPISFNAAGRQQLKGHLTAAMMRAPLVGRVPPKTPLTLTIDLSIKDLKSLFDTANKIADPKSASYRKYVTPKQFADMFGATPADYQKLLD